MGYSMGDDQMKEDREFGNNHSDWIITIFQVGRGLHVEEIERKDAEE